MTNQTQQKGQTLAEFALILPILLIITFGVLDFGRVLFTYSVGANAMRDAVRFANILGYQGGGGLPSYQDCDAIEAQFAGTVNDIFLGLDPNDNSQMLIEYFQMNNLQPVPGETINYDDDDPMSNIQPVADCDETDGTYPLPQNASGAFQNGDLMRIWISTDVPFVTPFLESAFGQLRLEFVGQRSIVTRLDFAVDPDDTDFDGLSDAWEIDEFGSIECYTGTDDGDSGGHVVDDADGNPVTCPAIDGDGCDLLCEAGNGADPNDSDSDDDGLLDGEENSGLTSLTNPDTDGDGRTDAEEILGFQPDTDTYDPLETIEININGEIVVFARNPINDQRSIEELTTNPLNPDSDGDGFGDGQELGPNNRSETPTAHPSTVTGNLLIDGTLESRTFVLNPASADTDDDGWSDNSELDSSRTLSITVNGDPYTISELLTDPTHNDTDRDGLLDGPAGDNANELTHDADPTNSDTDDDDYGDGHEVYGANPTASLPFDSSDYGMDITVNGLSVTITGEELSNGLEPNESDSDGDGLRDGFELRTGTNNPYSTNPVNPDTDGDASDAVRAAYGIENMSPELFYDGAEMTRRFGSENYNSDPTNRQTDNDDGTTGWRDNNSDGISEPQSDPTDDIPPEDQRDTTEFDLPDSYEFTLYRTNPNVDDTDGDGLNDWEETYRYCWYDDGGTRIPTDPRDPTEPMADGNVSAADRSLLTTCDGNEPDPVDDPDGDGCDSACETENGTDPNVADSDGDGLNDGDEIFRHGTDPTTEFTDSDSLNDYDEIFIHGTDPTSADTDQDDIDDDIEINNSSTNPTNPDTDGDGLSDGLEYYGITITGTDSYYYGPFPESQTLGGDNLYGSNTPDSVLDPGTVTLDPNDTDSDDDGYPDGMEAFHLTGDVGPQLQGVQVEYIPSQRPDPATRYFQTALRPDRADTDGDGILDRDELFLGTYPHLADTDGDTLPDNEEMSQHSTDPTNPDTDEDGIDDGREVNGFDVTFPNLNDITLRAWADVVNDPTLPGINPNSPDTDGDGIPDGVELQEPGISYGIQDPNDENNTIIYNYKTYPHRLDSDVDCVTDYGEAIVDGTDPTNSSNFIGEGCGDNINTQPKAQILFDLRTDCPGRDTLPVICTFADASTDPDGDGIATYEWRIDTTGSFDPNNTVENPSFEFQEYGVYMVELRVQDDHPTNPEWSAWTSVTFTLTDNSPPKAQILFSPETDCDLSTTPIICTLNEASNDSDQGDSIAEFDWIMQGSPGSFNPNNTVDSPEYSFPSYGEYTVGLRVQDDHPDFPLWSVWDYFTFTLEEPLADTDNDWILDEDETNIYGTDPNESDLDHIQNTYTQTGFDDTIQQYLADGTLIGDTYTSTNAQDDVRITVVSVQDPDVANNEGQWGVHLTNQYGMTDTTTFRINNNPKIYSATGYVSMEELVEITLEDLKQAPNPQFDYIEWAP